MQIVDDICAFPAHPLGDLSPNNAQSADNTARSSLRTAHEPLKNAKWKKREMGSDSIFEMESDPKGRVNR